jgi:hypothetical protein
MMFNQMAQHDFNRAINRASWRRILSRLTGKDNQLLPYDEVRARLPIRGQHYIGLREIEIEKIVGSMGRYNDFDRAFLPTQKRTMERWINIDRAHYEQVRLPPVELVKIGDIYFVKDGNHRVSVARERGQQYIDAYVTEIDIPIKLAPDLQIDDLELKKQQADFLIQTELHKLRPDSNVEPSIPDVYPMLLEHIATHRWYLGIEQNREVSYEDAVVSWYDRVYFPVITAIRGQGLTASFPGFTEADLYMWIMEYQKYLRQANSLDDTELARETAIAQLISNFPKVNIDKLINTIEREDVFSKLLLEQERAYFFEKTRLNDLRLDVDIVVTIPGKYERLLDHIDTHRWYLGEQRGAEVDYQEAVESWYDHVYLPIVEVIRERGMLSEFPNRTETDLYLWIVRHQWYLKEAYGEDIPIEQAADEVSVRLSSAEEHGTFSWLKNAFRKLKGH